MNKMNNPNEHNEQPKRTKCVVHLLGISSMRRDSQILPALVLGRGKGMCIDAT